MLRIPEGKYLDWFKFFREDGTPLAYEELPHRLLMKDGRSHELVYRLIHLPTGAERWMYLRSSPILDGRGHVAMIINIFRDVSDVKRQAVELARLNGLLTDQSARLNNLIKNIPGAVWEADVQNNQAPSIRVMNDYFGRLLGYESKEGTADPYYPGPEDVHPDDRPAIARGVIDLLAGKPTVLSYRIRHHEGHYVDVETYCSVASDDNGVKHLYGVTMDITKRKQAEQAALQQAEMLRQSNDDLQQFAYVASHDLQEPLRMVTSYLQLVEQRYASKLDDDAREFIGYAVDGSNRMKALIQDLLMYSRVETSNRDFAEMRVQDALDAAVHNLQLTFEDTKAALNVSALPTVRADQSQIAQLFQNLIANAIKFRSERPPVIEIGCVREDAFWHFKVADNGIGIEPQHLERIFVIFQRLHTRSKYPGTGIGLAICKRVIERHGGKIWAESQPGVGTAIHFTLPSNPERSTP
jgi:PAS domain S-box-containing protein